MGTVSRYWTLVGIDGSGGRKVTVVELAHTFFQAEFGDEIGQEQVPDQVIQKKLLLRLQNNPPEPPSGAEWCLRCLTSHMIEQACIHLETQFGQDHGVSRYDLLPFVLQDQYPPPKAIRDTCYPLLFNKILQTYQFGKGSLSTWVTRLVRSDRALNACLIDHGIYLVSDWAILNDTTPQQVERILSQFHCLTRYEVEEATLLLKSYHAVYRHDRIHQRQPGSRRQCPEPSPVQLTRMRQYLDSVAPDSGWGPPGMLLAQLQTLARQLRQYRIAVKRKDPTQRSLDQPDYSGGPSPQLSSPGSDAMEEDQNDFLRRYREQFCLSLDQAIADSLNQRLETLQRRNPNKADQFLKALYLFHCRGQAMTEIAPQVALKAQYQVSRLLKLKDLRADIQRQILGELQERVLEQAQAFTDPSRLQALHGHLEGLLSEQVEAMVQEAATEASIPGNRPVHSLYARRMCHDLDQRLKP